MKYAALGRNVGKANERLHGAVGQVSTGLRVQRPSDDPAAMASAQRFQKAASRHRAYIEVGQRVSEQLEQADTALTSASDVVQRLKELALQMSSGAQQPQVMEAQAQTVAELKDALLSLANTEYQDRYLFGGVQDGERPFDSAGDFVGSIDLRSVEVASGTRVEQVSGANAFGAAGGVDLFAVVDELSSALAAGDQDAVRETIDGLGTSFDQLVSARQQVGGKIELIQHAREFSEGVALRYDIQLGELLGADIADAVGEIEQARVTLQGATQAAARANELTDLIFRL